MQLPGTDLRCAGKNLNPGTFEAKGSSEKTGSDRETPPACKLVMGHLLIFGAEPVALHSLRSAYARFRESHQ
jgi:hypothetical protein